MEGVICLEPTANTSVAENKKIGDECVGRRGADSERLNSSSCPHVLRPDSPIRHPIWNSHLTNHSVYMWVSQGR